MPWFLSKRNFWDASNIHTDVDLSSRFYIAYIGMFLCEAQNVIIYPSFFFQECKIIKLRHILEKIQIVFILRGSNLLLLDRTRPSCLFAITSSEKALRGRAFRKHIYIPSVELKGMNWGMQRQIYIHFDNLQNWRLFRTL